MAFDTNTIALISVVLGFIGMAWAIFWPVKAHPGSHPISSHWDIVYVNDEGVMQFTLVRVIKINPSSRRMTAWCATAGSERIFKLGKIVKATDVRSGARINMAALIDRHRLQANVDSRGAATGGDSVWWTASRLGLH